MAMNGGVVEVDESGNRTGSGLALELYDKELFYTELPEVPTLGSTAPPYTSARPVTQVDIDAAKACVLRLKRDIARRATAHGQAIVTYMQLNAKAVIPAGAAGDGLQKTPSPNDPNTPTKGPSAQVLLGIT